MIWVFYIRILFCIGLSTQNVILSDDLWRLIVKDVAIKVSKICDDSDKGLDLEIF